MVALVEGGLWRPMFHARSPKRNQALYYTPPCNTRTSSRLSLAAKREEARRTLEFSSRVARDPRLYSHDDERSSDGTFFQKRLAMPPSLFRRVLPSLLLYRYLYIITILFPPIFCFCRKVAEDFSLLNFFFFFFHKLWFCSTTWEINLFIYFFSF